MSLSSQVHYLHILNKNNVCPDEIDEVILFKKLSDDGVRVAGKLETGLRIECETDIHAQEVSEAINLNKKMPEGMDPEGKGLAAVLVGVAPELKTDKFKDLKGLWDDWLV